MKNFAISRPWLWLAIAGALTILLVLLGLGVVLFVAGPPEYDFETVALYEAPVSGYRIEIRGRGIVRAGQDLKGLSSGRATIVPLGPVPVRPIEIRLAGMQQAEFTIEGLKSGPISRSGPGPLRELLASAGYGPLADDEVAETHEAINGVLSGPKGTLMEGQSKRLRVVRTQFR